MPQTKKRCSVGDNSAQKAQCAGQKALLDDSELSLFVEGQDEGEAGQQGASKGNGGQQGQSKGHAGQQGCSESKGGQPGNGEGHAGEQGDNESKGRQRGNGEGYDGEQGKGEDNAEQQGNGQGNAGQQGRGQELPGQQGDGQGNAGQARQGEGTGAQAGNRQTQAVVEGEVECVVCGLSTALEDGQEKHPGLRSSFRCRVCSKNMMRLNRDLGAGAFQGLDSEQALFGKFNMVFQMNANDAACFLLRPMLLSCFCCSNGGHL